ncbi:MAG: SDR family oxidoreductase [Bacteroidetes bacterium]|nr:SDR family oxidoreductase [Bacteroidota bacterium]
MVIITGSNGLLGQKLTDLYLKHPEKAFVATGKGPNRHPVKTGYVYEEADITDHASVRVLMEKYRPASVINTAAMTNVDACESDKVGCDAMNIHAVENLALLSAELGFRLIHLSTDFIFDGTHPMYTEDEQPKPLSYYGKSKWEGEKRVTQYAKNWAILRTVLVYGVVSDMSRSNIVLWAYNTLKNGTAAKVVNDQYRTPTLAEDLAMGCFLAEQKQAQGIYNIAGSDYFGIHELMERVAQYFGFQLDAISLVSSTTLNQPAKRPPTTGLDISKAQKELGYEPHSFNQGLEVVAMQAGWL